MDKPHQESQKTAHLVKFLHLTEVQTLNTVQKQSLFMFMALKKVGFNCLKLMEKTIVMTLRINFLSLVISLSLMTMIKTTLQMF